MHIGICVILAFVINRFIFTCNTITKHPDGNLCWTVRAFTKHFNLCQLPVATGNCTGKFMRYFYDASNRVCRAFNYSGCGGNRNRFYTQLQCQAECFWKLHLCIANLSHSSYHSSSSEKAKWNGTASVRERKQGSMHHYSFDMVTRTCKKVSCKQCRKNSMLKMFADRKSCEAFMKRNRAMLSHRNEEIGQARKQGARKALCYARFHSSLRMQCKSFIKRQGFFYEPSKKSCQQFWFDESCSRRHIRALSIFKTFDECQAICASSISKEQNSKHHLENVKQNPRISAKLIEYARNETNSIDEAVNKKKIEQFSMKFRNFHATLKYDGNSQVSASHRMSDAYSAHKSELDVTRQHLQGSNDARVMNLRAFIEHYSNQTSRDNKEMRINSMSVLLRPQRTRRAVNQQIGKEFSSMSLHRRPLYMSPKGNINHKWTESILSRYADESPRSKIFSMDGVYPAQNVDSLIKSSAYASMDCLEHLAIGNCNESYPAYFYNKETRQCEPFAYSGCDGNANRFFTLSQCEHLCQKFMPYSADETDCLLPVSNGYGGSIRRCELNAGLRFYYEQEEDRCEKFWFNGCGGNENRYYSEVSCNEICKKTNRSSTFMRLSANRRACFMPFEAGKCSNKMKRLIEIWSYDSSKLDCERYESYAGCELNKQYFASHRICSATCKGLTAPKSVEMCAYLPEWGHCNQLNYVWFFNLSSGACEQFLYGSCAGNPNRFNTYKECKETCIQGKGACDDLLDRGRWCEPMSNRYYYNNKMDTCKGFHYTGCGTSSNNFETLLECVETCKKRDRSSKGTVKSVISSANDTTTNGTYANNASANVSPTNESSAGIFIVPTPRSRMVQHIELTRYSNPYSKTPVEWMDHERCSGFRYNISGKHTLLKSFFCQMEENGICQMETFDETRGDERCYILKPWLEGWHSYSWFWVLEQKPSQHSYSERSNRSVDVTRAFVMPLSICDCDIC